MLSDRQSQLLDFIITDYVRSAEPVGSAHIVKKGGFDVSSATVRNEMQELEENGYLAQPHTSAGRVPTDKAYRYFVNKLLQENQYGLEQKNRKTISEALLGAGHDPRELTKLLAQTLSELSNNLVICNIQESEDFFKNGLSNMMKFPEFREFDRTYQLASFFDEFDRMFEQLERHFFNRHDNDIGRVRIFIGGENLQERIKDETVICSKYYLPHGHIGSMTLIGPMRMDYGKNIGLVSYATALLNKIAEG